MILLLAYIASCVLLGWTFVRFGIAPKTQAMVHEARSAVATVQDRELSDIEKERAVQRASITLLGQTAILTLALGVVFVAAALPVALGVLAGQFAWAEFGYFTIEPLVVIGTIISCIAWAFWERRSARGA